MASGSGDRIKLSAQDGIEGERKREVDRLNKGRESKEKGKEGRLKIQIDKEKER